ncbi:MAG: hypothetical protein ABSB82_00570 [Terriglobia bacterium]
MPSDKHAAWTRPDFSARSIGCIYALVLLALIGTACLAQQPCTVPVRVLAFDSSSFPKEFVDRALAWKQASRGGRPAKPGLLDMGQLGYAAPHASKVVLDLPAKAFLARDENHPISVRSVTIDRGPRRIVFVVDNGKETNSVARKIETAVITDILSKARAEDSFALLTARGPRVTVLLGAPRDTIQAAAEKLDSSIQGKSDGEGVPDALLEASTWLQTQRPGDTIFLLAMRIEGRHKASVTRVRKALGADRVRLFGFQLGPTAIWGPTFGTDVTSAEVADGMFSLASRTGGEAVLENTEENGYELRDARLQQLRDIAERMYNSITEYNVLELSSVTGHLRISLSPESQKGLLVPMDVLYPGDLPPCKSP